MVSPYNIRKTSAAPAFEMAKELGWETLACSPFVRGRVLNEIVAAEGEPAGVDEDRAKIADVMLRFSLFQNNVDRLIVSMRKTEWVRRNIESVRRGVLTGHELDCLVNLAGV